MTYKTWLAIGIGALAGYAYYYFIGCSSGHCPISSKPLNATAYGAVLGFLTFSNFNTFKKRNT